MALYLALDAGGTKTACALADEERILARAEGASIKTLRMSPAEASANLQALLLRLASSTGADLRADLRLVRRTAIGASGVSAPAVRAWLQQAIADTIGSELILLGDEVIALDGAFPGRRGILVIAGTGSNIVGRAATGAVAHAGGWGPMLADQGSGHWIGQQALQACFQAIDAAPASSADFLPGAQVAAISPPALADLPPLLVRLVEHLELPSVNALIGAANAPDFRFAALVPVIVAAARAGDRLAAATIANAGAALARLVSQAIAKVDHLEAAFPARLPTPEVAFIGGILANIPEVREAMYDALANSHPGITMHDGPADALAGALWHARGCPS